MKYAVVYSSKTGNTKQLADKISEVLPSTDCLYFGKPDEAALIAPLIYVGFWTDKGMADTDTMEFLKKVEGKNIILFGTAGFGTEAQYMQNILDRVGNEISKTNTVLPGFMCQGKMPLSVRKRYETILAGNSEDKRTAQLIANFDMALSHPDEEDMKNLVRFLK